MRLLASFVALLLRAQGVAAVKRVEGLLNVHLVCHTHDDAGWLKTVDQYFYGANNTIAHAGVQYILDSVVSALEEDPERKFVYAEQAFLWRWWRQQDPHRKASVRHLVSQGRLSFINGGWVMHDEAATHYVGMVDQTHLGHTFLREEFGEEALPRVAWQIDPFGHSATQASLLGAQAGFDALYFGRIDYQDREKRIAERDMEMMWRASRSSEQDAQIFTGVFHSGNYGPPVGFCFDQACQDEPIMDDPLMADYNVERRASDFADACQELGRNTLGDDVMLQMGGDFGFENANAWFKNLEILMKAVNKEGRVNVFFSTPQLYTEAKHASGLELSVKKDDFFPYADCPHCYWTGYFTSRPGLKRLERVTSGYLQAARQLLALAGAAGSGGGDSAAETDRETLAAFERAQALVQHHDGVSGTSKQHVADDYAQRLDRSRVKVEALVSSALSRLAFGGNGGQQQHGMSRIGLEEGGERDEGTGLPQLRQCRLANVSTCDATMEAEDAFVVVAYNPLPQRRTGYVDVPISWPAVAVTDGAGTDVEAQVVPFRHSNLLPSLDVHGDLGREGERPGQHPYTLMLPVGLFGPLAAKVFHVSKKKAVKNGDDNRRRGDAKSAVVGEERVLERQVSEPSTETEEGQLVREQEEGLAAARLASDGTTPTTGNAWGQGRPGLPGRVGAQDFSISSDRVTLTFNGTTGRLSRMETHAEAGGGVEGSGVLGGTVLDVDQGWFYYPTFDGGGSDNAAGNGPGKPGEGEQGLCGISAAAEAFRLHGELRERLDAPQDQQKGGAYIFRPQGATGQAGRAGATPVGADAQGGVGEEEGRMVKEWWVEEGPIVSEVHQVFSDWVTQTIRLRRGQAYAEVDWAVGPVPVGSSSSSSPSSDSATDTAGAAGKEVISRFWAPSLASKGAFYTDSNGREFQRRVRNERPTWDLDVTQPVAGNYYPATAAVFLRDEGEGEGDDDGDEDEMQLSVLTDRAQGVSSLADGELELMAHRRLLTEDQRGVGEALNETTGGMSHFPDWKREGDGEVFRGTHYLVISKKKDGMKAVRSLMDEVFSPFLPAFGAEAEAGRADGYPLPLQVGTDGGSVLEGPSDSTRTGQAPTATSTSTAIEAEEVLVAASATATATAESRKSLRATGPTDTAHPVGGGLMRRALPANVGLMTLMRVPSEEEEEEEEEGRGHHHHGGGGGGADGGGNQAPGVGDLTLLVRLAHRFAKGEDAVHSLPSLVDLSRLVLGYNLVEATEIALTGGGALSSRAQRLKWTSTTATTAGGEGEESVSAEEGGGDEPSHVDGLLGVDRDLKWTITLGPMEIKTYRLSLVPEA